MYVIIGKIGDSGIKISFELYFPTGSNNRHISATKED